MTMIDYIIMILWMIVLVFAIYFMARLIMKAWLTEIDLYINRFLKKYLSKIQKEHEESKK